MIVGRHVERSRLHRLVADAKDGRGGSLTLRGEAGIGKTALLDHASAVADGMRVCRVVGLESEAELPYAALQLLLARYTDRFDALPDSQAQALRAAFGTGSPAGDRHLVGAATLTLLAMLAAEAPLLCLFDDVHWFDQSSVDALLFAARRLHADPVATVFAVRDGVRPFTPPGEAVTLPRLDRRDAAQLLAAVRAVPHEVADRIVAESGGNPLAIVELAGEASDAGTLPAPVAPLPAVGRLEEHFRQRIHALPAPSRRALLLAAANHGSELRTFVAAGARLTLDAADLAGAEHARMVRVTSEVVIFRHPLIRAAAYQEASFAERGAVHAALAGVLVDPQDADRRAWHLAAAAHGADDAVAAQLEQAAARAGERGGPAAATRALERAAQLSSDRGVRGRRLVAAARAAYDAGQLDRAAELAAAGLAYTEEPGEAAEAAWIRAQVAYERDSPAAAGALAIKAAEPILATDPPRAVAVLTEATWCARDAADAGLLASCGARLRSVPGGSTLMVEALVGFTDLLGGDVEAAVPPMRALLLATGDGGRDEMVERLTAGFMGLLMGQDATALRLLDEMVADLRGEGALGWLPYALEVLTLAQLAAGRIRDAEANAAEAVALAAELSQDMEVVVVTAIRAWLAAVRGDAAESRRYAEIVHADPRRHAIAAAHANWALAVLDLAGGRPYAALDRLDAVCEGIPGRDVTIRAVPDHVEAAVRAGAPDRAARFVPQLAAWATHTGSRVAAALLLRCEALLCQDAAAQERFEAALAIDDCGPYDRARTHLAYGEWLRRRRRPAAARTQLAQALAVFERIGALGWRPRVQDEFVALGDEVPRNRAEVAGVALLTPQELQVVRLAAQGMTNPEIAARLFLSPRTVGYHLYKAYPKLGVSRRGQLSQLDV